MNDSPVALVTGSGRRRVGWHVAWALGQRGYRVALHYHTSAAEAHATLTTFRGAGIETAAWQADLTDETAVRQLVADVRQHWGRIDVLVHCASIWERKPLEQVTAGDVRRHLEVNTVATFVCCQQAGLVMVAQPWGGTIVNLGDWAVARPYLHYAAYFPSKGAVEALTRTMAVELGTRNPRVRVNCVLPGPVMLPDDLPPEEKQAAIRATLVQREGRPDNVAAAVLSLVENDFVTGVCLPVDGGRTIYAAGR
jgi:pteridine reductase